MRDSFPFEPFFSLEAISKQTLGRKVGDSPDYGALSPAATGMASLFAHALRTGIALALH